MTSKLAIEKEEPAPNVCMFRLTGELDGRGGPALMDLWRRSHGPEKTIVIHLAGVEFISSSGVGALLAIMEEATERGESVHLMAPSPNVRSVMRLLGLERYLPVLEEGSAIPPGKAA